MFKTNTGKEIFYIFLWLIGIIAFYWMVDRYILEPSKYETETTHTEHPETTKNPTEHAEEKKSTSEDKHKVAHTLVSNTVAVHKSKVKVETKKENISIHANVKKSKTEEKSVDALVKVVKEVKKIQPKVEKKTTIIATADETLILKETSSSNKHSDIVESKKEKNDATKSKYKAVSIPTVPTIPSVPTVSKKHYETNAKKVAPRNVEEEVHDLDKVTENLKKELSRDEQLSLVESARNLVVGKAEAARAKAMEGLER